MGSSVDALALIRGFTGIRAPGFADRRGALSPFPSQRPLYRLALVRPQQPGCAYTPWVPTFRLRRRVQTAGFARAGSAPAPPLWRWGIWPMPAPAELPQSLSAQLPVLARRPLLPVHLRPKPGSDLTAAPLLEPMGAASGSEETLVRKRLLPGPMRVCCL